MSAGADPYRGALAAAHEQLARLESEAESRRGEDEHAAVRAALFRERARCVADMEPKDATRMLLVPIFLPFGAVAGIFAIDRSWGFSMAALILALAVRGLVGMFFASSARAAGRQVELIDERLAQLDR